MNYTNRIVLDLNLLSDVPVVRVKQGDASARWILATLMIDGVTFIPEEGTGIQFRCEKPDGHAVIADSRTVDPYYERLLVTDNRDGTVLIELTEQTTSAIGRCRCDLCLFQGDIVISTIPFVVHVVAAPNVANLAVSSNDFSVLRSIIERGENLAEGIAETLGTITFSSQWSGSSSPYTQYVTVTGYTVTANTKIDLVASPGTIEAMLASRTDEIMILNENGTLRAYAIGERPSQELTVQACLYDTNRIEGEYVSPVVVGSPVIAAVKTEVDNAFDESSLNPVENRVITAWTKEPELTLYQDEDTKLVYVATLDGVLLGDGILVEGGGGGGGGSTYTPRLTNLMDSRDIVAAQGTTVALEFRYTSVDEEDIDDGPGVGTIKVNGVQKMKIGIPQGDNSVDITSIIESGNNTVVVTVENSEGITKSLKYTVNVVSLSITTTFSELSTYSGNVNYSYTITGAGNKIVYFVMDGTQIGTMEVSSSGRSQSFELPEQSHGGHVLEVYATLVVEGMLLRSNMLTHGMIWINESSSLPAIASTFDRTSATEGETLSIPYIAYDPMQENAVVTLTVFNQDGTQYSTQSITVDRLPHTWSTSDYPSGSIRIVLSCGSAYCSFPLEVTAHELPVDEVTDGLVLKFDATGRSNGEENPGTWSYGDVDPIVATFSGFGWSGADGWVDDDDGATVLRFLPGDTMAIPFRPFATDARATGYTIEAEFATRDVRDYDSVVLSCMNGGRGFRIASQEASLSSEQSSVSMLFKEDARVRVAFSIENRNQNRLVYIYINGIMCGVTQYPTDDNFQQASPVGLTIGAQSCGLDLYKIRCYNKGLTRAEQLDNFIVDRSTLQEREDAASRNDILNESDEVAVSKLPDYLPYMIVNAVELPQYKGDKKTGVEVSFFDPLHPERNWTAGGVEMDVQGTSSAGYPVKNYKIKLKNGITYTLSGDTASGFEITEGELPTKTICFKADFASSENANNVVLAKFYNDIVPYETEPQEDDGRVRQGIDGFGIALFWQDRASSSISFLGKGNCNVDKGNPNIFGFTSDYPNAQSWEFKNNTSNRVLFKSADFSGNAWLDDFEARYPEDYEDATRLSRVVAWVASTDRDAVQSETDKAARLQKFVDEFEDYFFKTPMLFYYLFTEAFLMVDNRAKNMFLTTYDGTHWIGLPYDFDTAIGINNEGALAFGYSLEDTDQVGSADVYNGQNSVLWKNIRDGFTSELASMYRDLRSMVDPDGTAGSPFSYAKVAKRFTEHQSVWPEALWNEDAFIKYLQPYLTANENYLAMLQGNKASQRDWWLFNRFRYLDSKYQCGDASSNFITLRCYAVGDITLTPYADIYARIKYGSNTTVQRANRNRSYVMECTLDQMNDTEVYIYSSDRIASVGDLSHLKVGLANFSMAPKLQSIKLGDESASYENLNLGKESNTFDVGANELLETVNIANCKALGTGTQKSVDLSGCQSLKTVIATGTKLRGITLPNGGHLQTLKLPDTLTNFTVLNQQNLSTLVFEGHGNLETLRVENTPSIPIETLILQNSSLNRVRLVGVDWTAASAATLQSTYDKLITCAGMNADGSNTQNAVVQGIVRVGESISAALLADFTEHFPELTIIANGEATLTVRFRDWDGTVLDTQTCGMGGSVTDPVAGGRIATPTRPASNRTFYTFSGWDKPLTNITANTIVTAVYDEEQGYVVTFVNDDAAQTVLYTALVHSGQNVADPVANHTIDAPAKATDAQYVYTYIGWDSSLYNITQDKTIKARYATGPSVTVIFVNYDDTELYRAYIASGANVEDPVTSEVIAAPTRAPDTANQINYVYSGWDTSLNNITADTTIRATYAEVRYYVVIFKNPDDAGGTILYQTTVNRNGSVTDPVTAGAIQTPTRTPEATYNYVYKGWDAAMSGNVTSNLTYTAVYRTDQQFTVSFVDWDGTRLDTQLVEDESDAVEPVTSGRIALPARASTAQYTYTFYGWSGTFTTVKSDLTITAVYTETVRSYTYRFLNNDNTVLKSGTVAYGTTVTPPSNPSYVPENEDMVFNGWSPSSYVITADTDFTAQYLDTSSEVVKYLENTMTVYESDTATVIGANAFYKRTELTSAETTATSIGNYAFNGCTNLGIVDLTAQNGTVAIGSGSFGGAIRLTHLIIRSSSVATMSHANALASTAIADGVGAIYVPANLVDSYKAASNWSIYAKQIYPISAYPVTDFSTISDSWAEIFAAEDDGTYVSKYSIGDLKKLTVDGTDVYMRIAAIDADTLASDSTQTAKITWISAECLTKRAMHSSSASKGWLTMDLRAWLRDTILPTIDATVRSNIKEVNKTYTDYTSGSKTTSTCTDTIWIPSFYETSSSSASYKEASGVYYSGTFTNVASRIRRINRTATVWWLRTMASASSAAYVGTDGTGSSTSITVANNVLFGFCT